MTETYPDPVEGPGKRRMVAARAAQIGIVGLFALALPIGGSRSGDLSASSSPVSAPGLSELPPGWPVLSALPAGWPGPTPEVDDEHSLTVWNTVFQQCQRFMIAERAIAMYHVLWEESRLQPGVVSPNGMYEGISQFLPSTFRRNVRAMKRLGVVPQDADYSPFEPGQAIEVMAWMWSQGYSSHWGPYQKVARRLEMEARTAGLTN